MSRAGVRGLALAVALATAPACAADPAPAAAPGEIVVNGRALPQIGVALSGSQGTVGYRDLADRPLGRVGELAEAVPGLIATQHSGSGKANQYFLRGFNLDHGTDFAGFVDGAPINLRTHGHGQGYLDLNFLIPELVERIDYRKGPYFADVGDFSAAGTVAFATADRLAAPIVEATAGSYGYYRLLAAGSAATWGGDLLAAVDGTASNGPWTLDERLRKLNGLVKFSRPTADGRWSVQLAGYRARWNATDQVPLRAIRSGLIGRYGNIDPFLGGRTTRVAAIADGSLGGWRASLYAIGYRFRLVSNFTYFLADPANGDEFRQVDRRGVFGGSLAHASEFAVAGVPVSLALGGDARYDRIGRIALDRTREAAAIGTVRADRVDEASGALYATATARPAPGLRVTAGARADLYGYRVDARTLPANSGRGRDALLAPKAALAYAATRHLEFYANYGESFHSNDVRGATIRTDPATGDPADRVPVLVRARGAELGMRIEYPRVTASLVGYALSLASELVFTGDGGTTEPNAASRRRGFEATLFWRPWDRLTLDAALAGTHTRFRGVPAGERRIPNAVPNVLSLGAEVELGPGMSASLRLRHFGGAPLIEDDRARSRATSLVNLGVYRRSARVRLGLEVLNLLGSRDNDITYFYASRLPGEPADGVEDRHLHPVEPRQFRGSLRVAF